MANYRYITSNGNWSTLAQWEYYNGAAWVAATVLPTVVDDVYSNGFVVQVDQTVSVKSIRNHSTTSVLVGGRFEVSTNVNITTVEGIYTGGVLYPSFLSTQACILINGICNTTINSAISPYGGAATYGNLAVISCTANATVTINGAITGGNNCRGLYNSGNGSFLIVGPINGGVTANYAYSYGFYNDGNISLTITGIIEGGSGSGSGTYGFYNTGVCNATIVGDQRAGTIGPSGLHDLSLGSTFNIIGNQYASSNTAQNAMGIRTGGSTFNITGNQYGNYINSYGLAINHVNSIVNITGSQYGGSYTNSPGVVILAGSLNIIGNQYGAASYGVSSSIPNINIIGIAYASVNIAAIYSSQIVTFTGKAYNNLSTLAIFSPKIFYNVDANSVWEFSDFDGNSKYLYGAGVNIGNPLPADVRSGVIYDPSSGTTGTCAVPNAADVVRGVPVDNTVGTWAFDTELITRLQNCSTVAITGQQIASYNGAPAELIPTYEKRYDYVVGSPDIMYLGAAPVGTLDSSPVWTLTKLILAVDGSITSETHATDSWDNHLTAIYS